MISIINIFVKTFAINLLTFYSYFRILGVQKINTNKKIIALILILGITLIDILTNNLFYDITQLLITYLVFVIMLGILSSNKFGISAIITITSISISYTFVYISAILVAILSSFFNRSSINPIYTVLVSCIYFIISFALISLFFKLKRFKNGFSFIKNRSDNEYLDAFVLIINALIIFVFLILENIHSLSFKDIAIGLFVLVIILFIVLQRSIILYQKHKLQTKTLKDYEQEIAETRQKLSTALQEKQKLVKSNHEFYHRQEALNKKLNDLINKQKLSLNSEFGKDLTYISDRLNTLSNEYVEKTKMLPKLNKTNIQEIDDMLSYMQSECNKNNIELLLKIECDINHIIENYITKSQLETLLGDLIRNAIIAINHCNNEFKSIMTVFGIKDDTYEICILDSGIPFETTTLVNLGLQPASTHLDEGGTGIGFITTFETINSCNASFIINEITNSNYTKSLEIKFDNKNEYVIISKRIKEINEVNNSNREIILRG